MNKVCRTIFNKALGAFVAVSELDGASGKGNGQGAERLSDDRQGLTSDSIAIEGKSFHDPMVPTGPNVREPKNRRAVIDLGG